MTSPTHTTFVVERTLPRRPQRAFRYFADPALKARWTRCHPDWQVVEHSFRFEVGSGEMLRQRAPDGVVHDFRSHYLDIADGARIIYAYAMSVAGRRISTSMATVLFQPIASGTALVFTEQAAFLDDTDLAARRNGTGNAFEQLALALADDPEGARP